MKSTILGVEIDTFSHNTWKKQLQACLHKNSCVIYTPNPEILLIARSDNEYRHVLNAANLLLPDGVGLKLAGAILSQPIKRRISGVDAMLYLCHLAQKEQKRVFLVGSTDDTLSKTFSELTRRFPKLQIVGMHSGGTVKHNGEGCHDDEVIKEIKETKADMVFVAFGAPKQECWISQQKKQATDVSLWMGVGGAFDMIASKRPRAPRFLRSLGLEWLWRLILEPSRIGRIFNAVIVFPFLVVTWKLRMFFVYRPNVCSFVINTNDDILIVKRQGWHDHWQLPQGGMDRHESIEQGARREFQEETGLTDLVLKHIAPSFNQYTWKTPHRLQMGFKGQHQHLVVMRYLGEPQDVKVDEKEISDYKWVSLDQLLQKVHPVRRDMTKKAIDITIEQSILPV